MNKRIFVSYSRHDKALVLPLVERINQELGLECWIDMKGIESGEEFEEVIIQAIDECEIVLFMLSDASLKSIWTKREVYYAERNGKRIVPVLVDGDGLRGWFSFHFGNIDFIDIHSDEQQNKLISNLHSWLGIKPHDDGPTSPFEQDILGNEYYYGENGKPQDYVEAVKWFLKSAEQGFAAGQCDLGLMFFFGNGLAQSDVEAAKWFLKAAEQGDADGQYRIGWMYEMGRGVSLSYMEAVKWYRKAAEQGMLDAQWSLGQMYQYGRGVSQSDLDAVNWYRQAAEHGNANGQYYLGWMYDYGRGVNQSYREAIKWYRKAAKKGHEDARKRLKELGFKSQFIYKLFHWWNN